MTDLPTAERIHLMNIVLATEQALRELCRPDKVNLASFGNMVPHLHWHIIPRFADDSHFPESIWGKAQRSGVAHAAPDDNDMASAIALALAVNV